MISKTLLIDDQSSIQSHSGRIYNINNNNNNQEDQSETEADETFDGEYDVTNSNVAMMTSVPPHTVMCAMRRTLDYLDMTPSSSSFLHQLPQSEEDDDDDADDILNMNNNNNNSSPSLSNANNHPPKSNLLNEKPVKNLIDSWTKVAAASSNAIPPNKYGHLHPTNRSISETNLASKTPPIEKVYQSTADLNLKQFSTNESNPDLDALKIAILDIFGFEISRRIVLNNYVSILLMNKFNIILINMYSHVNDKNISTKISRFYPYLLQWI